jgi:hypothetical protein
MGDGDDVDAVAALVDGVDRAVLAPSGAPQAVQRCVELFAEAVRVSTTGPVRCSNRAVAAGSGSRFMPRRLAAVNATV